MGEQDGYFRFRQSGRQHLNVYKSFMNFGLVSALGVIVVLVLMAVFLL